MYAAHLVFKVIKNAVAYLIAAWRIGTGALFLSFIAPFKYYQTTLGDPGIFSTTCVAIAKGIILLYMSIGLTKANELPRRKQPLTNNLKLQLINRLKRREIHP